MQRLAKLIIFSLFCMYWAEASLTQCRSDLEKWARSIYSTESSNFREMVLYSGKWVNDLGLYFPCLDVDNAEYVIFEVEESPAVVFGLCLPDSCTISDYWEILKGNTTSSFTGTLKKYTSGISESTSPRLEKSRRFLASSNVPFRKISMPRHHIHGIADFTPSATLMLVICILIILLAIIGTAIEFALMSIRQISIISLDSSGEGSSGNSSSEKSTLSGNFDISQTYENQPKLIRILLCFSLYTNFNKLFAVKPESKKDPLDCLNAVRVLSICWVVFGHMQLFRAQESVVINIDTVPDFFSHFAFTIVNSAPYSVDTFFWLSGFLQGYLMTQQLATGKKVSWPLIVAHRFIRILPLYMFIFFFGWTLTKYAGNGPKWYNAEEMMHKDCSSYFWTYMLFVNNFVIPKGSNNCMTGAWYLPNDMQFFLVSLPILYLYARHSRIYGWGLLIMGIGFSMIANGSISYNEHFHAKLDHPENQKQYMDDLYYKPYCRVGPYFIGLLGGFIYHAYKKHKIGEDFDPLAGSIAAGINKNRYIRWGCYAVGLFLINFFIFIQYDAYSSNDAWSRRQNSAYFAFQRFSWGLGLTLFFLPILMGHMSFLRPFLQSNWWVPTAKLVFGIYLFHMIVGDVYFYSQQVSYFWCQMNLLLDAVFVLCTSALFVIPLTLLVESPTINLEKLLLRSN